MHFLLKFRIFAPNFSKIMNLKVIAYARNGHTDKFGIPRQSREDSPILTRIVFEPEYAVQEALRGIEGYSHLWLLWGFSEISKFRDREVSTETPINWSPTVRPPRLGGNRRMGVFATRSPFRPNPIGMSSVKLLGIRNQEPGNKTLELLVSGADLLDGTPIYDIKPYLRYSDCHPEAVDGFAEETKDHLLEVDWSEVISRQTYDKHMTNIRSLYDELTYILSQDPRPGYQHDPEREYKLDYAGWNVAFCVRHGKVIIKNIQKN